MEKRRDQFQLLTVYKQFCAGKPASSDCKVKKIDGQDSFLLWYHLEELLSICQSCSHAPTDLELELKGA